MGQNNSKAAETQKGRVTGPYREGDYELEIEGFSDL
jgi:hypothetical protein